MHGKKKRGEYHYGNNPKQTSSKRVREAKRSDIRARLRNLDDNWEAISERFIKGIQNESRNDGA